MNFYGSKMYKTFWINTFNANGFFLHPLETLIFHVFRVRSVFCVNKFRSVKHFWILSVRKLTNYLIFFWRKFSWLCKSLCFWKTSWIKEKVLLAENFLVCGKFPWSSKNAFVENFLVCGKVPRLWKSSLIKENLLSWMQKK